MIQFIKFATHDPEGFALVRLDAITGIASTSNPSQCKIVTKEEEYLVEGTLEFFVDILRSWIGSEVEAVPGGEDATAP